MVSAAYVTQGHVLDMRLCAPSTALHYFTVALVQGTDAPSRPTHPECFTAPCLPASSGFHDYCLVFLRPARPTPAMRRLLKVHPMSYRLRYLQGSAASAAVSVAATCCKQPAIERWLLY